MTVAAVILAAGFSRRLGRPKQDVMLEGKSLLQHAMEAAQEAGFAPVLVVLREGAAAPPGAGGCVVWNPHAAEGMASSVRVGVAALAGEQDVAGAVLMTCDQPLLTAAHLLALCEESERITGSAYGGRVGTPAYFPRGAFPELLKLEGDTGARALLREAASVHNEALALDVDTEDDLVAVQRVLARRRG